MHKKSGQRRILRNDGFSLTEALIAVALIGAASVAFSSLLVGMQKGQNNVKFRADADTFDHDLRSLLSSTINCSANFKGKIATTSASYTVTTIKDNSGAVVYQGGTKYEFGNVIYNQSLLNGYAASNVFPDMGQMNLTTTLSAPQVGAGAQTVKRPIILSVQLSTTDHQTIVSCIALSEMTDGIWQRSTQNHDNIYFAPPNMIGGRVGIGTDQPVGLLSLEGNGNGSVLGQTGNSPSVPDFPAIRLVNTNTTMGQWGAGSTINNMSMVQTYAGGTGSTAVAGQIGATYSNVPDSTNGAYVLWAKSLQTPILFETTNSAGANGYTEKMRLTSDGALVIGSTKPAAGALLDVNGPAAFANQNVAGVANAGLYLKSTTGALDAHLYQGVDNNINFKSGSGGRFKFLGLTKELFDIDANGLATGWTLSLANEQGLYLQNSGGANDARVYEGVGGNLNLFSSGAIKLGNMSTGGNVYIDSGGNLTASGAVTATSDRRLKTEIRPIENALEQLESINGYTYFWKKDPVDSRTRQVGVIAQDVQKVYPELVHEMENQDTKPSIKTILTVDYEHLVAVVIAAIHELKNLWSNDSAILHQEIDRLKAQNQLLLEKNRALENENSKISERFKNIESRLEKLEQ